MKLLQYYARVPICKIVFYHWHVAIMFVQPVSELLRKEKLQRFLLV